MGKRAKIVVSTLAAVAIVAASSVGVGRLAFDRRVAREIARSRPRRSSQTIQERPVLLLGSIRPSHPHPVRASRTG